MIVRKTGIEDAKRNLQLHWVCSRSAVALYCSQG